MTLNPVSLGLLTLFSFATSSFLLLAAQKDQKLQKILNYLGLLFLILAIIAVVFYFAIHYQVLPLSNLSAFAMSGLVGIFGLISALRWRSYNIPTLLASISTFILFVEEFFIPKPFYNQAAVQLPQDHSFSLLLTTHVSFATLGQTFAIIACAFAILYLWQRQLLKKKRLNLLTKSPQGLDKLESLLNITLWLGFTFLTLSLMSGAYLINAESIPYKTFSAKITWSLIVWLWYLTTLVAKNMFSVPSKQIAKLSLVGFILSIVVFLMLNIILPNFLGR